MVDESPMNALSGVVSPGETIVEKRGQLKGLLGKIDWVTGLAFAFVAYSVIGFGSSKINRDLRKGMRVDNLGIAALEIIPEDERSDYVKDSIKEMRENNELREKYIDEWTSPIFAPFYVLD